MCVRIRQPTDYLDKNKYNVNKDYLHKDKLSKLLSKWIDRVLISSVYLNKTIIYFLPLIRVISEIQFA